MSLVIHPNLRPTLNAYAERLPHALLLWGDDGVGLQTIAKQLAGKHLFLEVFPKNAKGEVDAAGTISVEAVRTLYEQTRAKRTTRTIILIDNVDKMSHGAQNAFLKLLEEPGANVHFLLTTHNLSKLLPTIHSRLQQLHIPRVSDEQTQKLLDELDIHDETKRRQFDFIAAGLPAELHHLADDAEYFTKKATSVLDAREFLTGDQFQQLLIVQKYQSNREATLALIDSAITITRRSVSAKAQPQLIERIEQLLSLREKIVANQSIKLQLAHFVL